MIGVARTAVLAALLLAGCADGDETPVADASRTPAGDEHILEVAEGVGGWDLPAESDIVIELGHNTCEHLNTSDGDFDGIDSALAESTSDAAESIRIGVTALAGVPAYCPEWVDELEAWMDAQEAP